MCAAASPSFFSAASTMVDGQLVEGLRVLRLAAQARPRCTRWLCSAAAGPRRRAPTASQPRRDTRATAGPARLTRAPARLR